MYPRDVITIIDGMIHKSHITKLNREYHKLFGYLRGGTNYDVIHIRGIYGYITFYPSCLSEIYHFYLDKYENKYRYRRTYIIKPR